MRKIALILTILALNSTIVIADDYIPDTEEKVNILANAIKKAENSKKFPYGIKSVKCSGELECRKICKNTIRNNVKRWIAAGKKEDYLVFLWRRYCPPSAHSLNKNWLKNVKMFLKSEE